MPGQLGWYWSPRRTFWEGHGSYFVLPWQILEGFSFHKPMARWKNPTPPPTVSQRLRLYRPLARQKNPHRAAPSLPVRAKPPARVRALALRIIQVASYGFSPLATVPTQVPICVHSCVSCRVPSCVPIVECPPVCPPWCHRWCASVVGPLWAVCPCSAPGVSSLWSAHGGVPLWCA